MNIRIIKHLTILLSLVLAISNSLATTYYVSNTGIDTNNGTSPTSAFATVSRINELTLEPGDSVLFKCGDTWRAQTLYIRQSGTEDNYITFASYGTGNKPRILGSIQETSWSQSATLDNVWVSTGDYGPTGDKLAQIFLATTDTEGNDSITWGAFDGSGDPANLNMDYAWTMEVGGAKVYLFWSGDPNNDFNYIEIPQLTNCFEIDHQDYIEFDNLEIAYASLSGIRDRYPMLNQKGLRVTNCHIHHFGYKGSATAYGIYLSHSDSYYAHNEIHDCGRRGLSLSILDGDFPNGSMRNVLIEDNHFHHGWHTTGLDMITGVGDVVDSVIIRNNYFEGSPEVDLTNGLNAENSNHIFISNKAGGIEGDTSYSGKIYIYNNIFTHMHGKAVAFEWIEDSYICNNTFYGINPTIPNYQSAISLSQLCQNIDVKNNIIYNNEPQNGNRGMDNIVVFSDSYNSDLISLDYNLHYGTSDDNTIIVFVQSDTGTSVQPWQYPLSGWDQFRLDHPTLEANSIVPQDPMFLNPENNDFSLNEGSPAIGVGQSISWIKTDYYGNSMNIPPDLGAIQYGSGSLATVEAEKSLFKIYPNPVKDNLKIDLENAQKLAIGRVRVINNNGQVVMDNSFSAPNIQLDFSGINPGIYLLQILSIDGLAIDVKKIVVAP